MNCDLKHVKNWFSYKRKLLLKIKKGTYFGSLSNYHVKSLEDKCQQIFPDEKKKVIIDKIEIYKGKKWKVSNECSENRENFEKPIKKESANLRIKIENQKIEINPKKLAENNFDVFPKFQDFTVMNNKVNVLDHLMKMNLYFRQMAAYKQMNLIIENEIFKRQFESLRYNQFNY